MSRLRLGVGATLTVLGIVIVSAAATASTPRPSVKPAIPEQTVVQERNQIAAPAAQPPAAGADRSTPLGGDHPGYVIEPAGGSSESAVQAARQKQDVPCPGNDPCGP